MQTNPRWTLNRRALWRLHYSKFFLLKGYWLTISLTPERIPKMLLRKHITEGFSDIDLSQMVTFRLCGQNLQLQSLDVGPNKIQLPKLDK
jgi:hypothetical protein